MEISVTTVLSRLAVVSMYLSYVAFFCAVFIFLRVYKFLEGGQAEGGFLAAIYWLLWIIDIFKGLFYFFYFNLDPWMQVPFAASIALPFAIFDAN